MSDNSWYVDFLARTLGWWAALSPVALQHVCAEVARAEGSEMNLTGGHANAGRTVSNNNSVFLSLELRSKIIIPSGTDRNRMREQVKHNPSS